MIVPQSNLGLLKEQISGKLQFIIYHIMSGYIALVCSRYRECPKILLFQALSVLTTNLFNTMLPNHDIISTARRSLTTTTMNYQGLKINILFPTLLGETEFPGCEALNQDLAAYIRNLEQNERDYSQFSTVNHGWQSSLNFLDSGVPAIQTLKHFINNQIEIFLKEWGKASFSSSTPSTFHYSYKGWAVILRQGGFQYEHVHTKTDLVGVYYVEVPTAPSAAESGNLTLIDPRSGRVASRSIWETAQYTVRPKPGMFLLFPSFLPHRVNQVQAAGERISINLDVSLHPSS